MKTTLVILQNLNNEELFFFFFFFFFFGIDNQYVFFSKLPEYIYTLPSV